MAGEIGRITGTFLDEITFDIGSQNWSADDWRLSFDAMEFIGIDTVIIIRGGLKDLGVFPSRVIGNAGDPDLARLFLDEAERHRMRLFFGTYDSGTVFGDEFYGKGLDYEPLKKELDESNAFVDEVLERYGGHPAFYGWYLTHEVGANHRGVSTLFREFASYLKSVTPAFPVLISPYFPTKVFLGDDFLPFDEFCFAWRELLAEVKGLIDIMAIQDGQCLTVEYMDYLMAGKTAADEFGIEYWSNIETFERNLSYNFPPRDIRTLRRRLEMANPHVSKHITFEFAHFMSPNSCFPGAANLYRRYCETVLGRKSPF